MLNYLLTPYLTRVLTGEEYGVVTGMYAVIPFALVALTMGLETGYFRFSGLSRTEGERRALFSSTWGAVLVAAVVFAVVASCFASRLAPAMGYGDHPSFVWIVACVIAVDVAGSIPFCRLRARGDAKRFVMLKIISVMVNAALCVFFYSALPLLAAGGGWISRAWDASFMPGYVFVANLVASVVTFALLCRSRDVARPGLSWRVLRPVLVYSAPLLAGGIAGTANEFIDRLMIEYLMPADVALSTLGVYGAVVKIGVILPLFVQVYRYALEPYLLSGFQREEFGRVNAAAMKYFMIVASGLFLVITLFADLFALLLGKEFREGMKILPLVLASNILSGVVFNLSFWYKQANRTVFGIAITMTGLVFTILFGILLVPTLGYTGAAITRLACEVAMVIASYALNRRYYPVPYDLRRIGEHALVCGMLVGAGLLARDLADVARYPLNALLCGIFFLYATRREGIQVISLLKSIMKK
jgi:O-antigen/teichoic acid export membrane protein